MFESKQVIMMACGTMHCVCLARVDEETPIPKLDPSLLPLAAEPEAKKNVEETKPIKAIAPTESKKRPIQEITQGDVGASQSHEKTIQQENGKKQLKIEQKSVDDQ
jgi:hypothetical protein